MNKILFRIISLLFIFYSFSILCFAESKDKAITLTHNSIGPIDKNTPYDFNVIRKIFSPLLVKRKIYYTEDMSSDMILVYKNRAPLLTIIQGIKDDNTKVILCVSFLSKDIQNQLGPQIGAYFSDIYKRNSKYECQEGMEEMSETVICRAPNAKNIHYVFYGKAEKNKDATSFNVLKNWKLIQITWLPYEDYSLRIHQYCRAEDVLEIIYPERYRFKNHTRI